MQTSALNSRPSGIEIPPQGTCDLPRLRQVSLPASLLQGEPRTAWHATSQEWQPLPLQARALGNPSSLAAHAASPSWWHCTTIAPASAAIIFSEEPAPLATAATRTDTHDATNHTPHAATAALQPDGSAILRNRHIALHIDPSSPQIIRSIIYNNTKVTADAPLHIQCHTQDHLWTLADTTSRRLRVLSQGPVTAAVEVTGLHSPDSPLDFSLRFELHANLPTLVMRYWFFHRKPACPAFTLNRLTLALAWKNPVTHFAFRQLKHGLTALPRTVVTPHSPHAAVGHDGAVHLRITNPEALHDDTDYPDYHMPPTDEISPWLASHIDNNTWVAVTMDDICDMQPKAMRATPHDFQLDLWPDWASPLTLPQGRSRQVILRITFNNTSSNDTDTSTPPDAAIIDHLFAASGQAPPQLLSPHQYAQARVFDQHLLLPNDHAHERFDSYLSRIACPPTVADMFDLGDTPDPGYQTTYLRTGRRLTYTAPPSARQPVQFLTGVRQAVAPWSNTSQFEPIWANNEYDVIWCIGSEIMRASRTDLLPSLRWFARHAIEVDFVHHSDDLIKHRATPPHCARHTTAGGYPSHFWTEGVLQYYALTGDEDALTFAQAIGDKIVMFFTNPDTRAKLWHPTRELGWALLALAALVEFDPQPRYTSMAAEIAASLIQTPLTDDFIAAAVKYAFGYASIVLGLDKWQQITHDAAIAQWLVTFARKCAPNMDTSPGVEQAMSLCILHAGYKHAPDDTLIRSGMRSLERITDSHVWTNPQPYTKPYALLYRPMARFFGDAARQGDLARLDYRF